MMVMTAKVDFKKIILLVAGAAAIILLAILLLGGNSKDTATASAGISANGNAGRIQFLESFGWDVSTAPTESGQIKIPADPSEVFDRYNTLQKGQGYDLSSYAGKKAMRYVYKVNNYPGATEPVYATVLVYKDQIIGGDITDTSAGGKVQGFKMPSTSLSPTTAASPTESTAS